MTDKSHPKKEVIENPEAMAAFQALVEENHVAHLVGVPAKFEHFRNFIYTADGAYEVQVRPFANFTTKLKKVDSGINKKMVEGVEFTSKKIPFQFLQRALSWFRLAYAQPRKSEALYIIMWDLEKQEYVEYVPRQHDGPAHAKEIDSTERPGGCILVAHIHSHPNFTGKFSGIDDNDDRRCSDGAIFGVIGHVNRDHPDMQWRCSVAGNYVELNPHDIFTSPLDLCEVFEPAPKEWVELITEPPPPPAVVYGPYDRTKPGYGYGRDWAEDDYYGWM